MNEGQLALYLSGIFASAGMMWASWVSVTLVKLTTKVEILVIRKETE